LIRVRRGDAARSKGIGKVLGAVVGAAGVREGNGMRIEMGRFELTGGQQVRSGAGRCLKTLHAGSASTNLCRRLGREHTRQPPAGLCEKLPILGLCPLPAAGDHEHFQVEDQKLTVSV
jgi:hypothetical protein